MDVLGLLPKMPVTMLREIIKRAQALLAISTSKARATADLDAGSEGFAVLLDGVKREISERGLPVTFSIDRLRTLKEFQVFLDSSEVILPWFNALIPDMTRTERMQLAILIAHCLGRLIGRFSPVTLRTMLMYYHYAPDALEDAFPGYVKNGWIRFLLRSPEGTDVGS